MKKSISCLFDVVLVQKGRLPPKESGNEATIDAKDIYVGKNWRIRGKEIDSIEVIDRNMTIVTEAKTFMLENAVSDAHQWETFCSRVQALADKYKPEKQFSSFIQESSSPRRKFGTQPRSKVQRKLIKTAPLDVWETFSDDEDVKTKEITPTSDKKEPAFHEMVDDPVQEETIELGDSQDTDEEAEFEQAADTHTSTSENITTRGRRKRLHKKRGRKSALSDNDDEESEDDDFFNADGTFTTPAAHRVVSPGTTGATNITGSATTRLSSPQKIIKDQPSISSFFHKRVDADKKSEAAPKSPRRMDIDKKSEDAPKTPERRSPAAANRSGKLLSAASARMVRSGKKALEHNTSWLANSPAARSPAKDHTARLFGTDRPAWQSNQKLEDPIEDFSPTKSSPTGAVPVLQPRVFKRHRMTFGSNPRRLDNTTSTPQINLARDMAASTSRSTRRASILPQSPASRDLMQYMPSEPVKKLPLFRGLRNLGNTCYLNASLQMLNTLVGFTSLLKERGGGKLTRSIVSVSQKLANKTDRIAVDPRDVKAAMDEKTDKFVGFEQRDAHEFISDLVDNIHEELQGKDKQTEPGGTDANDNGDVVMTSDETLPTDDFCLTVQVCLKCNSCGYSRSKEEIYRHLSIDIINGDDGKEGVDVKGSVEKSLAHFFQPETREIKCEKCDDGVDASQTLRILSRPKALLLHLKRFIVEEKINSSPEGNSDENSHPNSPQAKAPSYELVFKKNKAPVAIPAYLSLDAFRVDSNDKQGQATTSASSPPVEYSLKSVVHHIGSRASSGHYTADAIRLCEKEQDPGDTTTTADTGTEKEMEEKWVTFDDGNSTLTTLERVTKNINRQRNAYMLLYTMNEEEKAIV